MKDPPQYVCTCGHSEQWHRASARGQARRGCNFPTCLCSRFSDTPRDKTAPVMTHPTPGVRAGILSVDAKIDTGRPFSEIMAILNQLVISCDGRWRIIPMGDMPASPWIHYEAPLSKGAAVRSYLEVHHRVFTKVTYITGT